MRELGRYDTQLQMFVENKKTPSMNHLRFLRRLADAGKFDVYPYSAPKGEYLLSLTDHEIVEHVARERRLRAMQPGSLYEQTIK